MKAKERVQGVWGVLIRPFLRAFPSPILTFAGVYGRLVSPAHIPLAASPFHLGLRSVHPHPHVPGTPKNRANFAQTSNCVSLPSAPLSGLCWVSFVSERRRRCFTLRVPPPASFPPRQTCDHVLARPRKCCRKPTLLHIIAKPILCLLVPLAWFFCGLVFM